MCYIYLLVRFIIIGIVKYCFVKVGKNKRKFKIGKYLLILVLIINIFFYSI